MTGIVPSPRPLYVQVRDEMLRRLAAGLYLPGSMLPSEQALADELSVSQGTVRKALDLLTNAQILRRHQGRGTFVAAPGEGQFLYKFFRLVDVDGQRCRPDSNVTSVRKAKASQAARTKLELPANSEVWKLARLRLVANKPFVAETIYLPQRLFPELDEAEPTPNNLYVLLAAKYGLNIHRTKDRLSAVIATEDDRRLLGCATGTPILVVDRIAYLIDGVPAEWRVSRCLSDRFQYEVELG
jgi:GntR family transcriptional regulator